jgi:hypothetical protein
MQNGREQPHSLEPKNTPLKSCKYCGQNKSLNNFSVKSGKNEPIKRWEAICKPCKAKEVKRKREEKKNKELNNKKIPKRSIEPKKVKNINNQYLTNTLSEQSQKSLDFGLWNNLYDKELDDSEKIETQSNLMAFVTVLGKAWSTQTGDYIELSKD